MFGLFSLSTIALVGLYVYVGVAAFKGEVDAGASWTLALSKAATWPVTIWSTIKKLYLVRD